MAAGSDLAGWVAKDSQDNATATATKAAKANKQHIVHSVHASFSNAVTKLLQILDGTTVVWEGYVINARDVVFPAGIAMTIGNKADAVLAASGTGGQIGKVSIHGVTV